MNMEEIFYNGTKLLSMRDINGDIPEIFICDGNRSSGKSTYFNRYYVNSFLKKHEKFVILKRFSYELGNIADSFFTDIQRLFFKDFIMTQKKIANGMFVALYLQTRFEAEQNYPLTDANLCGYGVAINTADVVKKNSHFFSDVQRILFDEFQSENDQYCAREVEKFISIHTSMARGGGKQVRYLPVHMVSNGITILNPYYVELGISERLQANTKFLKGDGFVLENNFNPFASQAQKTSAFNRAFSGNKYVQYASENVYLNDSKTFIDKPKGLSRYLATISYENREYAIRSYDESGLVYCDTSVDRSYPLRIALTTDDHRVNYVMLKNNDVFVDDMRYYFRNGCFRFKSQLAKQAVLHMVSY